MLYLESQIPQKTAFIVPIGDIHAGDPSFTEKQQSRLKQMINFVAAHENARVILMGDLVNVATRASKTAPWNQTEGEENIIIKLFTPIKEKIITAIEGNHEMRLLDYANYSITQSICRALQIPYGGLSCVVNVKVRTVGRAEQKRGAFRQNYTFYCHHTTGGGSTIGGKINRVEKLRQMVVNADVYLGGHSHLLAASPVACAYVDSSHKKVEFKDQWVVDCGGYLEWSNSYAEAKEYPPNKLGSPIIELQGRVHKIKVSL